MAKCLSPFVKDGIPLPCGKCYECKSRKVSGWSFRLMKEAEVSTSAFFVTLTYDTDHVPITPKGYMSLYKRDVQLFMKRLRDFQFKKVGKNHKAIKYYACGEYGGHTKRPHYHIILFNAIDECIQKAWALGSIHIGEVQEASVGYTLKYISKPSRIPEHKNDDRVPEFSVMSKKLGISYVSENTIKWHRDDLMNRKYLPLMDGKKICMPRYYNKYFYTQDERQQISKVLENKIDIEDSKKSLVDFRKDDLIRMEKARKSQKDSRIKTVL